MSNLLAKLVMQCLFHIKHTRGYASLVCQWWTFPYVLTERLFHIKHTRSYGSLVCQWWTFPYVLTERLCQDALENYFGHQCVIGGRKDNPTLRLSTWTW